MLMLPTLFLVCLSFIFGCVRPVVSEKCELLMYQLKRSNEEVSVTSFDGIKLEGTLSLPSRPRALLIPVHGSFLQDREGALDGTKKWMFPDGVPARQLFKEITEIVLPLDIGTYRYDKRASGKSGGVYEDTDLVVLAKDLASVIGHFRKRFPGLPIGIVGQSEGGLVSVAAWEYGARPEFFVVQAPALEPFDLAFEFQKTHAAKPFLEDPNMAKKYPYVTAFYHAWGSGELLSRARDTQEEYFMLKLGQWSHVTSLKKYRQYLWDGLELLRHINVPTAVLIGTEDGNVRRNFVDRILEEQKQGLFPNLTVFVLKGLEHSFREYDPKDTLLDAMAKPVSNRYVVALTEYLNKVLPTTEMRVAGD